MDVMEELNGSVDSITRKRARSTEQENTPEEPLTDQVSKKKSVSEMEIPSEDQEKGFDRIALLDAGAQYGKVIDRRVRELKVECVLLPLDTTAASLKEGGFRCIIISGGPNSVNDNQALPYDPAIFTCGLPILGICYGLQLINNHFGGSVVKKVSREDGQRTIEIQTSCPLFSGLEAAQEVLLTHGDSIDRLAEDLKTVGVSGEVVVAIQHVTAPIYGVQFHPEVDLSSHGKEMLKNFLFAVSECSGKFTLENREISCINYIRKKVGGSKVLSLVSGGVDSTVCTALLNAALGSDKVIALHIDNGFMRKNESSMVKSSLEALGIQPHVINASLRFYTSGTMISNYEDGVLQQHMTPPLHAVTAPEDKRRIIGDTFIKVANETMLELNLEANQIFLAQGTLRPDLIESASSLASGHAQIIKTHHNDTELVRQLRDLGRVVEPLSDFHKDEVRALGETLGLPKSLINRHPFPGPGLAIRVLCQSEPYLQLDFMTTNSILHLLATFSQSYHSCSPGVKELLQLLSARDQELLLHLSEAHTLSATLLPIHTVGVQGDGRTYSYVAGLSSNDTDFNWEDMMKLAQLIPRICHNINRVAWIFGPAVDGPIEDITPTYLTRGVLDTLRECDYFANQILVEHDAEGCVSQMPIILLPLHFGRDPKQRPPVPSCQRSVAIRTFITSDFMTGLPAVPGRDIPLEVLSKMVETLKGVSGISRVLYDLTSKPPGTTEWE